MSLEQTTLDEGRFGDGVAFKVVEEVRTTRDIRITLDPDGPWIGKDEPDYTIHFDIWIDDRMVGHVDIPYNGPDPEHNPKEWDRLRTRALAAFEEHQTRIQDLHARYIKEARS